MIKSSLDVWLLIALVVAGFSACQQETPSEKSGSQRSQSTGTVEQAVQETVAGIKGPMDKARGVEGTLEKAAERTAEQETGITR